MAVGDRNVQTTLSVQAQIDDTVETVTSSYSTSTTAGQVPLSTAVNLVGPGDNAIPIPAKAAGACIVPPLGSVNTKLLKGAVADTGVVIGPSTRSSISFPQTSMANLVIHSQVNETITIIWQ